MRRLRLALCLSLAVAGAAGVRAVQLVAPGSGIPLPVQQVQDERLGRLEQWLKIVARHAPGEDDRQLALIAAWPNRQLKDLWVDANALVQVMRSFRTHAATLWVRPQDNRAAVQVRYTRIQFGRLRVLACAAGGLLVEPDCMAMQAANQLDPEMRELAGLVRTSNLRGDRNYILRRAALLHTDVPVLAPDAMAAPSEGRASVGPNRYRMAISDGREIDLSQSAVHWEIARMLLDLVVPPGGDHAAPASDPMVRDWYYATAAWMQLREDHDRLHLDRALQLFPSDRGLLFLGACLRETFAGVPIQTAVRSAILPTGVTMEVHSPRVELHDAEGLFRRLLEIDPGHAEARLRLGRVLGLLGKHAEAAVELRRARAALTDSQLLYYAQLFLGGEEEALGNRDEARASYERAAAFFPRAQSPLLALSQLSRRSGDRAGALSAVDRLFALDRQARTDRDDPWWSYYVAQARDADDLLEALERPYLMERLR